MWFLVVILIVYWFVLGKSNVEPLLVDTYIGNKSDYETERQISLGLPRVELGDAMGALDDVKLFLQGVDAHTLTLFMHLYGRLHMDVNRIVLIKRKTQIYVSGYWL